MEITSIPDSPTSRSIISTGEVNEIRKGRGRGHERTKSESPEIRLSIHDVPSLAFKSTILESHDTMEAPKGLQQVHNSPLPSPHNSVTQIIDQPSETHMSQTPPEIEHVAEQDRARSGQLRESNNTSLNKVKRTIASLRHSEQIFDEIESDTESFHKRQRMHSAKRINPGRMTPERLSSPRAPQSSLKAQTHSQFSISSTPVLRMVETISPPEKPADLQQRQNSAQLSTKMTKPESSGLDLEQCTRPLLDSSHGQLEFSDPPLPEAQKNDEGAPNHCLQPCDKPASKAIIAPSQASDISVKNWSGLDVEHPIKQALSQGRKPDVSILSNAESHDKAPNRQEDPQPREVDEVAKDNPSQQEKQVHEASHDEEDVTSVKGREKQKELDVKEEASSVLRPEFIQETPERKRTAEKIPTSVGVKEDQADGKRAEEASARKDWLVGRSVHEEKTLQDRQSKEDVLSEQAEQMMLEAESTKQLQLEKLKKPMTPASSKSKERKAEKPRSTKYAPRTEEQKARRRANDARKKAIQGKAVEPKRLLDSAEPLFQTNNEDSRMSSEYKDKDSEQEKTWKTQAEAMSSDQSTQKPKSLFVQSAHHNSSSPSGSNNQSRSRKSLTPALPSMAVTKSPSQKCSLSSPSPMASRSSVTLSTPLRSVLKHDQVPSTIRRSVSFVNSQAVDPEAPAVVGLPALIASDDRPFKSLVELNNELALATALSSSSSVKPSKGETYRTMTPDKPVGRKQMVQRKLNVTRDIKMKGRALEAPMSTNSISTQERERSPSEYVSVSESSSDHDLGSEDAKAGPSSRRKSYHATGSHQEPAHKTNPGATPIDPVIEKMSSKRSAPEPLLCSSRSISIENAQPLSRSPALAKRGSISVSSRSTSNSDSDSDSELSSESDSSREVELPISDVAKDITHTTGNSNDVLDMTSGSKRADCGNQGAGRRSRTAGSQPMGSEYTETSKTVSSGMEKRPGLSTDLNSSHNGRHFESNRPTYFKYPTMSALRKMAEATTADEKDTALATSRNSATQPPEEQISSSSISEESTSSSEAEDDEDDSETGSRAKLKPKSSGFSGLRGVMKRKFATYEG